jgi:hypothetical protein
MSDRAGTYNVLRDFGQESDDGYIATSAYAVIAVIRLGMPLSFSRKKMASVTKDVTQGALLRAVAPLVISDDIFQLSVQHNKRSHTGQMSAALKQTDVNYLVEILPGDHVFAWIVNSLTDYLSLLERVQRGEACNRFNDGLKFVGRVHDVRKNVSVEPNTGVKTSSYSLSCTSFRELDTTFYYDNNLASKDVLARDLGQWLTRLGLDVEVLFSGQARDGIEENNVNEIVAAMLDLIVGHGPTTPTADRAPDIEVAGGVLDSASPQTKTTAPYSYLIPAMVGKLLGKDPADASKGVMSYADVLELLQGVQSYSNKNEWRVFVPDLASPQSSPNRRITTKKLLGTFLPFMPDFANRPLWQVFQQYLNPTINEMYTTLRVNPEGNVVPTIVMRQIPFTTEAFTPDASEPGELTSSLGDLPFTKFLSLPRWQIPATMIQHASLGRSDSTRINFVHIYGASAYTTNNRPIQEQIVNNPPIRDDLDIMRSGLHPYMTTVECFVSDQVGKVPGQWMALVADWTIGSQYTLNGNLESHGIQAPICVGDNIEFDKVVYHIEAVSHTVHMNSSDGSKQWRTSLALTNGMRADLPASDFTDVPVGGDIVKYPIYPGFEISDNTDNDPGLTAEHRSTTGGLSQRDPNDPDDVPDDGPSQLSPQDQNDSPNPRSPSVDRGRR